MRRTLCALVCTLSALVPVAAGAVATPASAEPGDRSLVEFLAADSGFDQNTQDFDVFDRYLRALLPRSPDGTLSVLADGDRRTTAFLPTDLALSRLVVTLSGRKPATERATWKAIRGRGLFNFERVLDYHLVQARTLYRRGLLAARRTRLEVVAGDGPFVYVRHGRVVLGDEDRKSPNAVVTASNLNRGNKQVGHATNRVMSKYSSGLHWPSGR